MECRVALERSDDEATSFASEGIEGRQSSCSPSPLLTPRSGAEEVGQVERPSLLQRRRLRGAFASGPVIDCALVTAEASKRTSAFSLECTSDSLRELYHFGMALGQGTTAVVYAARRKVDGAEVALKVMRMDDEELLAQAKQEFEILKTLQHRHIIRALDFFTYSMGAVLVLECFPGTTVEAAVLQSERRRLEEETARRLFRALMEAVAHLHGLGIIHRDVKPQNVLVSSDLLDLRLADFNTACSLQDGGALTMTGTVDYLPPEVLLGDSLGEGSDVWASGLCLHFMLAGALPLRRNVFASHLDFGMAAIAAQQAPLSGKQWQHLELSAPCLDVLTRCLEVHVEQRPTSQVVLDDAWFQPTSALA